MKRVLLILMLCGFFGFSAGAQEYTDQVSIYKLVLKDFIDSVASRDFPRAAIPDSSCEAVFYGGFPDSINKKYFGFEEISYFDAEVFRRGFIDYSKEKVEITQEMLPDSILLRIPMTEYRKFFTLPKNPGEIILSVKGFDKLLKTYGCECFCEISRAYFMSKTTALVYFHYQCGVENGFPNVYILEHTTAGWEIVTKLRWWNFH